MSTDSPIVSGFLTALDDDARERFAGWAELEAELCNAVAEAHTLWPGVSVDDAVFAKYVGERTDIDADDRSLPAYSGDLFLTCGCVAGDPTALRQFETVLDRTDPVLRRLGLGSADMDDVKQELRERLLVGRGDVAAKLTSYQGTGPLTQWLRAVAGRQAIGRLRRIRPTEVIDENIIDVAEDPELSHLKAEHSREFKAAFHAAIATLAPRDRAILRALVLDESTVADVAAVYRVHRVTASRWVSSIRHTLLRRTRDHLRTHLQLSAGELESLIRLVESQMELSLYRVLQSEPAKATSAGEK